MGTVQIRPQNNCILMNAFISSKLNKITTFCIYPFPQNRRTSRIRAAKVSDVAQLKQNWLDPLTLPPLHDLTPTQSNAESEWVLGIDLDLSGALAVLKTDQSGCSAQVFDSPHLPVLVGKRVRKRLDAKSIVLLLRSLDALIGTTAYIGQSIPYPQDGKQDDSRRVASTLFPSLSYLLKRKKDHGRAEALLIVAYGKGLKLDSPYILEELVPQNNKVVWQAQFRQAEGMK